MMLTNKSLLVSIASLLIFSAAIFADDLPDYDTVNLLSQKAKQTADDFYEKTFEMRMRYEYAGCFLDPNDKVKLHELATQASADLEKIAQDQNNLKKQIEDYQGDDWEMRFGQTGLWRRLTADLKKTESQAFEINAVSAITEGTTSDCPPLAIRSGCDSIRTAMQKIKCLGLAEPNEFETIAESLAKSECNDNPEMLLSLAILQNKYAPDKLKNTLSRHSKIGEILGKIILDCLASDPNLDSLNPVTAELVAVYVRHTKAADYKELLAAIAEDDRFKTSDTLIVAGVAAAETEPQKTIKFFIESSALQFQKKETLLDIDAQATAEGAARLAYDNFTRNNIDCNLAVAAFDNLASIASNQLMEDMQYNYGEILLDCGKTQNAIDTFTKLAETSKSAWRRNKANFQILKIQINAGNYEETIPQLHDFILNCKGQDEQKRLLRLEAMDLYCRTILDIDITDNSTKVLKLLNSAESTPDFPYDLYRAQATSQLGRLEESVRFLVKAVDVNDNSLTSQAVALLSKILDKIELWQQNARDFNEMLVNCANLAQFACKSLNNRQTALILAEVSTIQGKRGQPALSEAEGESFFSMDQNDIISMRLKARLLMTQVDFEQAANLWAKITELYLNESAEQNHKSYGWWQAKYYELECMSKVPSANLKDIHHTIEVLQNTYAEIPAPWSEKLDSLKQRCITN
jgi:tetratricopeptide (TPR) repeat protein